MNANVQAPTTTESEFNPTRLTAASRHLHPPTQVGPGLVGLGVTPLLPPPTKPTEPAEPQTDALEPTRTTGSGASSPGRDPNGVAGKGIPQELTGFPMGTPELSGVGGVCKFGGTRADKRVRGLMVYANLLVCGSEGDYRRGALGVRKGPLEGGGGNNPPSQLKRGILYCVPNYRLQGERRSDEVWLRAVLLCHQHMLGHRSGFAQSAR
jgi:hypothetical protein